MCQKGCCVAGPITRPGYVSRGVDVPVPGVIISCATGWTVLDSAAASQELHSPVTRLAGTLAVLVSLSFRTW